MRPFTYTKPATAADAVRAIAAAGPGARFLAGGTTLYDLMKLNVEVPSSVVDINSLAELGGFDTSGSSELVFGALCRMSDVAADGRLVRDYPALSESLWRAASQQLRNGLARVARVWKISRASVYRCLKETPPNTSARRPGPVGACSDAELADHIRQQIAASRLHGEGYRKLWARLRFAGVRASPRRVRRVMRENGLLAPHRVGRTEARPHDGTIITDKVNEMWGTDMTQTITIREGRANVFVAVEHANSEVVGIHASPSANRFEALEPVRQGVHRCFGTIAPGVARGLKLRH